MTDFHKVKDYYQYFDEWARLETPAGQLEYQILMEEICSHLKSDSDILDLGGGPGRYTASLSCKNYRVWLADISPTLIENARDKIRKWGHPENVKDLRVVNAMDLSDYSDDHFDGVLLFGPLYHLTSREEILACLSEVHRVLKPSGMLLGVYIPRVAGMRGIWERYFVHPGHVNAEVLGEIRDNGVFHNQCTQGFQEGMYMKTEDLMLYLEKTGFSCKHLRSIRGLAYGMEENLLSLEKKNRAMYERMIEMLNTTSSEPSIIETAGHALFVAQKS